MEPKLDGTEKMVVTPFDAHEQVVRQPHTHSQEEGYKPAEYEHQEFPKVVDVDEDTKEPVLAHGPEEVEEPVDLRLDGPIVDLVDAPPPAPQLAWDIAEEPVEPPTPVAKKAKKEE